jgi:hypothetical protein
MPIDTGLVGAESAFPVDRWNPWRPKQLASGLQALEVPWAVAAGWAIDLFAGRESRAHDDLEIVVARASFGAVRAALPELTWFGAGALAGEPGRVWPVDDAPAELHQTWGWDSRNECWRVDVFREPWEEDTWVCRRDPSIRRSVAEGSSTTRTAFPTWRQRLCCCSRQSTLPATRMPPIFARALPLLDAQRRQWLADALRIVHPGHDWLTLVVDR